MLITPVCLTLSVWPVSGPFEMKMLEIDQPTIFVRGGSARPI